MAKPQVSQGFMSQGLTRAHSLARLYRTSKALARVAPSPLCSALYSMRSTSGYDAAGPAPRYRSMTSLTRMPQQTCGDGGAEEEGREEEGWEGR